MRIEHFALASNSEDDSDIFFVNLLGLKKARSFNVSADLMEKFFGINKEQKLVRYENENVSVEVFITNDNSKSKDMFSHVCLVIKNRDELVKKSSSMGFTSIKVLRKDSDGYYLFIKDSFGNLYEIK